MAKVNLQLSYYSKKTTEKHLGNIEVDLQLHGYRLDEEWSDLTKEEQEDIETYEAHEFMYEIQRNEDD